MNKVSAIIITICLFALIYTELYYCAKNKESVRIEQAESDLPPGYSIVTNGETYRTKNKNGYIGIFDDDTYAEAVERAWRLYNHEENEKGYTWKEVTPDSITLK